MNIFWGKWILFRYLNEKWIFPVWENLEPTCWELLGLIGLFSTSLWATMIESSFMLKKELVGSPQTR